ncbi:MAG: maltotransferase domain-containing protein [Elusimicrobiota bacterium]
MITIKNVYPEIDGAKYPVKTETDIPFQVSADVYCQNPVNVWIKYRIKQDVPAAWKKIKMKKADGLKWCGEIKFTKAGRYEYTIEAGLTGSTKEKVLYGLTPEVIVNKPYARFAAWYEMFSRSQGKKPGKSATFKDMEERLKDIKKMGFNVVYLVPIHPIGRTARKGPNNSLFTGPNDPGCPWSIGNEQGGHKAIDPDLGTLDDFRSFVKKAERMEMKIALDIAFNCSRDHPYIKEHPGWFLYNADGTLKFAENPPKKYEDTVFFNFYPEDKEALWEELKSIVLFWIDKGVKIFRIDNPHTKPNEFWQWILPEIKKVFPDVIFLSEAFTHYDKLEELAKIGFDQSYTYFTWRNEKNELMEYIGKLTNSILRWYLRGNLFTNTPDICPPFIQTGGRPAFKIRLALASTMSSVYGMYNGFELCEADAFPGTEIYRNSEKYEYKVWDWDRPGNIKDYIGRLNKIREENPALHYYDNLRFCNSTNEHIISYYKTSPDRKNTIIIAVNLNPFETQTTRLTVPVEEFGIGSGEEYKVRELITDIVYTWRGRDNIVVLNPHDDPAQIFRIEG